MHNINMKEINMNKETKTVAENGYHYSVWLRQEHHTQFRIPRDIASSLEEAVQLVRDNDEKIHEYNVYEMFEDADGDEILDAEVDED